MSVGILAFGSLREHPGEELGRAARRRADGVTTPFAVEFARSSSTRDGAPTLVPVDAGGAEIAASVFVLDPSITEEQARDILYRRESGHVGEEVKYEQATVAWINEIRDFAGVDLCLYTALPPNIAPITPEHLAELAIQSARAPSGRARRDGISYLREQKQRGTRTPLMPAYEAEVLRRTGADDLHDAWVRIRAQPGGQA